MILNNKSVTEEFNKYCLELVDSLELVHSFFEFFLELLREQSDEICNIISKFKSHFSIAKIKKPIMIKTFSFGPKHKDEIIAVSKCLLDSKVIVERSL